MFLKNHKPVVIVVSILFAICIIYVGSRFIRHTYKNGYKTYSVSVDSLFYLKEQKSSIYNLSTMDTIYLYNGNNSIEVQKHKGTRNQDTGLNSYGALKDENGNTLPIKKEKTSLKIKNKNVSQSQVYKITLTRKEIDYKGYMYIFKVGDDYYEATVLSTDSHFTEHYKGLINNMKFE